MSCLFDHSPSFYTILWTFYLGCLLIEGYIFYIIYLLVALRTITD